MAWIPFERKDEYEDIYSHHHRPRRLVLSCCVLICTLLLIAILALGIATLIAYLILRPHSTHYEIVSASVPTLQILSQSESLQDTSTINAEFIYGLRARNPNRKMSMEYSKFNVQTLLLGVDIGHGSVSGFRVGSRSSSTVTVTTSAWNVVVNNVVGNTLRSGIERQLVTVQVKIDTRARAHIGGYTSFWVRLHAICEVNVTPPNALGAGTFVGARCRNI